MASQRSNKFLTRCEVVSAPTLLVIQASGVFLQPKLTSRFGHKPSNFSLQQWCTIRTWLQTVKPSQRWQMTRYVKLLIVSRSMCQRLWRVTIRSSIRSCWYAKKLTSFWAGWRTDLMVKSTGTILSSRPLKRQRSYSEKLLISIDRIKSSLSCDKLRMRLELSTNF